MTFNWKRDHRSDIGFIAQDVEKVFPELVHTNTNGEKSVEYLNMIAVLIEAHKKSMETHATKMAELRSRIQNIRTKLAALTRVNSLIPANVMQKNTPELGGNK